MEVGADIFFFYFFFYRELARLLIFSFLSETLLTVFFTSEMLESYKQVGLLDEIITATCVGASFKLACTLCRMIYILGKPLDALARITMFDALLSAFQTG